MSTLASSHAPAAGTGAADSVIKYSAAWQRCAPAKAAAPEQQRSTAGCATFGIVFFALAMLVTAFLGYAR